MTSSTLHKDESISSYASVSIASSSVVPWLTDRQRWIAHTYGRLFSFSLQKRKGKHIEDNHRQWVRTETINNRSTSKFSWTLARAERREKTNAKNNRSDIETDQVFVVSNKMKTPSTSFQREEYSRKEDDKSFAFVYFFSLRERVIRVASASPSLPLLSLPFWFIPDDDLSRRSFCIGLMTHQSIDRYAFILHSIGDVAVRTAASQWVFSFDGSSTQFPFDFSLAVRRG